MKMPLHYVKMTWPIRRSITWKVTNTYAGCQTNSDLGNKVIHLLEDINVGV